MSRRARSTWIVLLTTGAMSAALLVGCSGKPEDDLLKRNTLPRDDKDGNVSTDVRPTTGLTAVKGDGVATLKGVVRLIEGDDPEYKSLTDLLLSDIRANKEDGQKCLAGSEAETTQYRWVVDKKRGVDNVFVWIRPMDDKKEFFNVAELAKNVKGFAPRPTIDQPFCAFVPHALTIFPRYIDPEKPAGNFRIPADKGGPPATPQEFKVVNKGRINHNTSTNGDSSRMQIISTAVGPGSELMLANIQPSYKEPVEIKCSIHSWMKAWVWAFDHPFACVTGSKTTVGDKEVQLAPGEFRIDNIPAGVKVRIVAWHEEAKFFLPGGEKGIEYKFEKGENDVKDLIKLAYKKP